MQPNTVFCRQDSSSENQGRMCDETKRGARGSKIVNRCDGRDAEGVCEVRVGESRGS